MNRNIYSQLKDFDQNIINVPKIDWLTLPDNVTIQIQGPLSALAPIELLRLLVDEEQIPMRPNEIFEQIVQKIFTTNFYSLKQESSEFISVELLN